MYIHVHMHVHVQYTMHIIMTTCTDYARTKTYLAVVATIKHTIKNIKTATQNATTKLSLYRHYILKV